jgi:NhaP-type Na+/H+ or K+/H+ antiporter
MMDKISVGEVTKIGVGFALGYLAYKLISFTSQPQETPQQKQA